MAFKKSSKIVHTCRAAAMRFPERDKDLFRSLADVRDVSSRKKLIDHLSEPTAKRLEKHVKGLVLQKTGYKIKNPADRAALQTALQPHKPLLKRFVGREQQVERDGPPFRKQRGGWIFSVILATLIPVVVDLISRAVSKK